MKKWSIILIFTMLLVCLAGCGKQEVIPGRPYAMEVTYGEDSIHAVTGGYAWNWKEGSKVKTVTTDAVDPRTEDQRLTYFTTGESAHMSLDFAVLPDKLMVEVFSADDGFSAGQPVELKDLTLDAPLDGTDHLYAVTAMWNENNQGWGTCTYHFRFLDRAVAPTEPVVSDSGNLTLEKVLTMTANDFFGIQCSNYVDDAVKTCFSRQDKEAILAFLADAIPADATPTDLGLKEILYTMRLVTLDGSQLNLSFGTNGQHSCIQASGVVYEMNDGDLDLLWAALNTDTVTIAAAASGKGYQDISQDHPMADWPTAPIFGYVRDITGIVTYDEMRRVDDSEGSNSFHLEKGWTGLTMTLDRNCDFWILDEEGAYGKVSADELLLHNVYADDDVLYGIYTENDIVVAICQQPEN